MKLMKSEEEELFALSIELETFMEDVFKKKRNKKLYIALGQAHMAIECAKQGAIIEKYIVAKAW